MENKGKNLGGKKADKDGNLYRKPLVLDDIPRGKLQKKALELSLRGKL